MSDQLESGRYKVPFKEWAKQKINSYDRDYENLLLALSHIKQRLDSGDIRQSLMAHGMDIADIKAKLKIGDLESEIVKQDMDKPHYEGNSLRAVPMPPFAYSTEPQDDDYAHTSPLGKQGGGYVMKSDVIKLINDVTEKWFQEDSGWTFGKLMDDLIKRL